MPLNGKFLEKYGQNWKDMDDGEKQMALMSEIFDLREAVEPVKEMCRTVESHKKQISGLWAVTGAVGLAILIAVVKLILGL